METIEQWQKRAKVVRLSIWYRELASSAEELLRSSDGYIPRVGQNSIKMPLQLSSRNKHRGPMIRQIHFLTIVSKIEWQVFKMTQGFDSFIYISISLPHSLNNHAHSPLLTHLGHFTIWTEYVVHSKCKSMVRMEGERMMTGYVTGEGRKAVTQIYGRQICPKKTIRLSATPQEHIEKEEGETNGKKAVKYKLSDHQYQLQMKSQDGLGSLAERELRDSLANQYTQLQTKNEYTLCEKRGFVSFHDQ